MNNHEISAVHMRILVTGPAFTHNDFSTPDVIALNRLNSVPLVLKRHMGMLDAHADPDWCLEAVGKYSSLLLHLFTPSPGQMLASIADLFPSPIESGNSGINN